MTLDDFELGKAWLNQFPFVEREVGRQMLRSLRLVSHTQFEQGISNELIKLFAELQNENIALFSVIETLTDEDSERPPKRRAGSSADRVKHMNENLARIYGPRVQAHPTIESMRAQRMKNIVLVEDFVGTGRRLETYLHEIMASTLKSWISYKWTKLWIVSYGGLNDGVRKVLRKGYGLTERRIRLVARPQRSGQFLRPLCLSFAKPMRDGHNVHKSQWVSAMARLA